MSNILQFKCIKLALGSLYLSSVMYLCTKIVRLILCDAILSFVDLGLIKTVFHGTKSIGYLGPKIWDILPVTYKELPSLEPFRTET